MHTVDYICCQAMTSKTIPLSVRVSEEDAEFLASLELDGAATPSEKLRGLIAQARQRHGEGRTYEGALAIVRELLEPTSQQLRARELKSRQRSELIADTLYWLPDLVAYLMAGPSTRPGKNDAADLVEFEAGVAYRIFRFTEAVLRLGVTAKAPCYDPAVVTAGIGGTLELAQLVLASRQSKKGQ
jgi:hypothetical protein